MTGFPHADPRLRLSDAERETAARELSDHFAAGRLSAEEHSDRFDQIWAAKTRGELPAIFADLPSPLAPLPRVQQPAPARFAPTGRLAARAASGRRGPHPVLIVVAAAIALGLVLPMLPWLVAGLIAWVLFRPGRFASANRGRTQYSPQPRLQPAGQPTRRAHPHR